MTDVFALEHRVPGHLLALTGRLDVTVADAVDDGVGDLVLDVRALRAVDATGLGVLVGAHRRAGRAGRTLVLQDVANPVARVLRVTRLDRVLAVRRTTACAGSSRPAAGPTPYG